VLAALVGIDVDAADHVAGRRVENRVGEPRPLLEVAGVPLQVPQVVVQAPVVRPGALLPPGCPVDVLDGGRPRGVVGLVVLRSEWLQPESLRLETERDDEIRWDERPVHRLH